MIPEIVAGGYQYWGTPNSSHGKNEGTDAYITADGTRVTSQNRDLSTKDKQYNQARGWMDPGGIFSKKRRLGDTYLWDQDTGVESFLQSYEGDQSASDAIYNLLNNFKGSGKDLKNYLETMGPLYGSLEANRFQKSGAFRYMEDPKNWDMGAWSGFGQGAGAIAQGTNQSVNQARGNMARAGLGRSSSSAGIASLLQQQGLGQQSNLLSQTVQQASQNRMRSATQMQDAYRLLAQMSLSQQLTPRVYDNGGQGGMSPYAGAAGGAMAGAQIGMAAGPYGALAGAAIGGVAGYAGSK